MLGSILLAVMTGAAVLSVLWPLSRADAVAPDDEATDAAFYRAQLAEIERDAERGLIEPGEAETSRVEAARRLLAASRREAEIGGGRPSETRRRIAAVAAIVAIPAISLGLYFAVGRQGMPDMPLAARDDRTPENGMQQAVARIEEHLAKNPDDGPGHEVVAPVYLGMGRYEEAARSFAVALRMLGETSTRVENLAEAQVAAAEGIITAEARAGFERALALDPTSVRARYYRALALEQDGDTAGAIAGFDVLVREAQPGSELAKAVTERIVKLGGTPPQTAAGAIAALGEKDRDAAIRGMVEQLDARLTADGSDVEGWLRLVRSYAVLGDPDKARAALARARSALAGNAPSRERVEALARELGIGGS
jgi:cytochrome c-type biogenesis protein CcmH